jgi:uncharacterized phage-associated protein
MNPHETTAFTADPIIFDRFSSRGKKLRFRTPLKFTPSRNGAGDLLVIDEPKYSLRVYAEDADSLRAELGRAFGMMWQVFVAEGDRKLTAKAENLRRVLNSEIESLTVFDCAECLLRQLGKMPPMKLHKLLYYAQAWSLVWDGDIIFPERIEAWLNGPVIPALYERHKGKYQIETVFGDPEKLSDVQKETLDVIAKDYGGLSSQQISDLVHLERPWGDARSGVPAGERGRAVISPAALQEYYESLPPRE